MSSTTTAVALRDGVRVTFDHDTVGVVDAAGTTFTLRPVHDGLRRDLRRLVAGPVPLADLGDPGFRTFLDRAGRLFVRTVTVDGAELVRLEPTAREISAEPVPVDGAARVRLSRFAFCRSRDGVLVLESPLATVRCVLLHRRARELVTELGAVHAAADLAEPDLLGVLVGARLVEVAGPDGEFASDAEPRLRQWDFHDLLFHSRARVGRYDDPIGGVYPYVGEIEALPSVKPPPDGPSIALDRPTLDDVTADDPGLTVALEGRRTFRQYGPEPMTARQLGEFLYRVARVRVHRVDADGPSADIVGKPYPTGGSSYELELYVTVRRCAGLDPAIYYYDPVGHRLIRVNDDAAIRSRMLAVAVNATGGEAEPDVLITMTSRFPRVAWKYKGIAYATTLRHTGVLYQTMYLVATAMRLAPCGIGIGDADLSARAFGLDYLSESSVGDFLLGSMPPGDPGTWVDVGGWEMVNDPEWALHASAVLRHP
jgi:SagB-type dehydrogenase family enzyme